MIKVTTTEIRPYYTKVLLTTTDGEQTIYTDSPSQYEEMVSKFKHIISCKSEPVTLDADQESRLTAVRGLLGDLTDRDELQVTNFVQYGYITPWEEGDSVQGRVLEPMLRLLTKWEGVAREALLSKYKDILASVRYDKECGGVKFNGLIAFTDKQAQASITSTITMFQLGGIKTTKFKFVDGWQEVDLNTLVQLGMTVATHVQICFNAEEAIVEKLKAIPYKQLAMFKENPFESITTEDAQSVEQLYNDTVDQYSATMLK